MRLRLGKLFAAMQRVDKTLKRLCLATNCGRTCTRREPDLESPAIGWPSKH